MALIDKNYDYLFKILIIGDSYVGKSCLLSRFHKKIFTSSLITTIGLDFIVQTIEIDGVKIKAQFWDTAGQERFRAITESYYNGSDGIILVYDISNRRSFDNVAKWIGQIFSKVGGDVTVFLIGNKNDLVDEREVSYPEGEEISSNLGCRFFETSAKTGDQVDTIFIEIVRTIYNEKIAQKNIVILEPNKIKSTPRNKCC